ncbi:MAG: hypothetical protein EZS28_004877 [Streblomastix strix]|uniref:Uncharacterized protein n=1 Tax=Streblomastix strix TaxID=222440 RepID=A0A5J4WX13_9EUKA|nr:MAG: hypothetical protein EZS28_004877 [Streblomastix strix]
MWHTDRKVGEQLWKDMERVIVGEKQRAIKLLYVLAVLALLNSAKLTNADSATCKPRCVGDGCTPYCAKCSKVSATTPKETCPCPADISADPRKDGICKPPVVCTAHNDPVGCVCSTEATGNYPKALCEYDNLPACTDATTTPTGGCQCTTNFHPIAPIDCTCPLDNSGQYTKTQCDIDITHPLPACTQGHYTECICPEGQDWTAVCLEEQAEEPTYCTEGHFPVPDGCDCDPTDEICDAGSQPCVSLNTPPGCTEPEPEPEICVAYNDPAGCVCADEEEGSNLVYDHETCEAYIEYYALPLCAGATTPDGGCRCTSANHPIAPTDCTCPLDDEDEAYTQTTCLSDITHPPKADCDSSTLPAQGCFCKTGFAPEGCTRRVCTGDSDYSECICQKAAGEPGTCVCPTGEDGPYKESDCIADKAYPGLLACQGDTGGEGVSPNTCLCSGSAKSPTGCTCPRDGASLTDIPKDKCPCEGAVDDPRIGGTCPIVKVCTTDQVDCLCSGTNDTGACTCNEDYHNQACVCSEIAGAYDFVTCQATKICTEFEVPNELCTCTGATKTSNAGYSEAQCIADKAYPGLSACSALTATTVEINTCLCSGSDKSPTGCTCPKGADIEDLTGVPEDRCPCLLASDPREDGICPAYCTGEDDPSPACVCSSITQDDYSPSECESDKKGFNFMSNEDTCIYDCNDDPTIEGCVDVCTETCVTSSDKKAKCAAGSMRAALAVVVSALIIPALILFF